MRKIIYYVAASLDGFISGPNGDISAFAATGNGVKKYLSDLKNFDTVIMGRKTYEFGYKYGLVPGQPAYSGMTHYIFSGGSLKFENLHPNVHIVEPNLTEIENIQKQEGTDIYLCGGGQFAGWLLLNQKIDILKLKLNPILLGKGVRIFDNADAAYQLNLLDTEKYEQGLQIVTYQILYNNASKAGSFQVLPYNDSCRPQLLFVWEQSVAATHHFLTPADFQEIKEMVATIDFNAFRVFCLLHNDSVIGFIGVADNKVEMLFISPAYIGKGMGRRLMDVALNELDANEVDVNEQNPNAVNFYRKLGFEVYERAQKDSQGKDYPILKMRLRNN
jgi:dihydrofolate reductase/ribosomal protein S18 acetylase RimI-like enzyme